MTEHDLRGTGHDRRDGLARHIGIDVAEKPQRDVPLLARRPTDARQAAISQLSSIIIKGSEKTEKSLRTEKKRREL